MTPPALPYVSKGNAKVRFPIFSLGSATDCPSRKWCPFDRDNNKAAGRKLCYAQATERRRPNVLQSRRNTQAYILWWNDQAPTVQIPAILTIAGKLAKHATDKIVRMNEAGDLARENIAFACTLIATLKSLGISTYLYSKAPPVYQRLARNAGATVLHSEHDFIAVPTREAGLATGHTECPGTCGPCKVCPSGDKAWILEH